MSGPGGVAGDQLRAFVERIEHVEEEIKALNEDKKSIFDEAKNEGYDVKILKEVIRLRKQDPKERDEHESLLEVYLHAIATAEPYLEPPSNRGKNKNLSELAACEAAFSFRPLERIAFAQTFFSDSLGVRRRPLHQLARVSRKR